jgi:hypothetical protein
VDGGPGGVEKLAASRPPAGRDGSPSRPDASPGVTVALWAPPRSRSTAVILPSPTARVRKGRRGKISGFADRHLGGSSDSQLSRDIETTSSALIDYVALVFVLASVASGPLLVWFLLRTAH